MIALYLINNYKNGDFMTIKVTVDDVINALASDGSDLTVGEAQKVLEYLDMESIKQAASYAGDDEERREFIFNEICAQYWCSAA